MAGGLRERQRHRLAAPASSSVRIESGEHRSVQQESTQARTARASGVRPGGPADPPASRVPGELHDPGPGPPGRHMDGQAVPGRVEVAVSSVKGAATSTPRSRSRPRRAGYGAGELREQLASHRPESATSWGSRSAMARTAAASPMAHAAISRSTPCNSMGIPRCPNRSSTSLRPSRAALATAACRQRWLRVRAVIEQQLDHLEAVVARQGVMEGTSPGSAR